MSRDQIKQLQADKDHLEGLVAESVTRWEDLNRRIGILALDLDSARTRLANVREIHVLQYFRSIDADGNADTFCDACNVGPYPCPTIEAIGGAL